MVVGKPEIMDGGRAIAFPLPPESVREARQTVMKYRETKRPIDITVKEFRKKRSGNANAFCWRLCQAIGEAVGVSKELVYRRHVKDVGAFHTAVCSEQDAAGVVKCWGQNGLGWIAETMTNYDGTVTVFLYPGSSTYDSKQMSRLIDSLVETCDDLGLTVQIPEEVRALLNEPVD